jgi:hypothetical protein
MICFISSRRSGQVAWFIVKFRVVWFGNSVHCEAAVDGASTSVEGADFWVVVLAGNGAFVVVLLEVVVITVFPITSLVVVVPGALEYFITLRQTFALLTSKTIENNLIGQRQDQNFHQKLTI